MCMVSAVVDTYSRRWPMPALVPADQFPTFELEVKEAIEQDEKLGQPDCSDEKKRVWRAELDSIIAKHLNK